MPGNRNTSEAVILSMEGPGTDNITAIVLAGGKSTRMKGMDKSMLPVKGIPMIAHIVRQLEPYFSEIIIGANDMARYSFLGHRIVPDLEEEGGPLMGIYSCLTASDCDLNFVTACDIPDISISFIRKMVELSEGTDIVMPVSGRDRYEPLHAIYRKSVIPEAEVLIREKRYKITELFLKVNARFIPFKGQDWYRNINYLEEYREYDDTRL